MSGIAGIFHRDHSPIQEEHLQWQSRVLAHRGLEGKGVWCNRHVGLVHQMFQGTPESLFEDLPLSRANDRLVITADARIDNREELFSLLGLGNRFNINRTPDSELILAAYEKWGENCVEKLLGDFSFAIYDSLKQQLFCGRDHFGVKPLFYFLSNRLFVFGSEIKAILAIKGIPDCLNEVKIADFMLEMFEDKTRTFYQDILRLPPAHTLTVNQDGAHLKRYWSPDPSRELRLKSDDEYAEAYREIFVEAVRCRLRSAKPVGSMLSGGLDSSSVTCVAERLMQPGSENTLHTFSAVFESVPKSDERLYIQAVLAEGNYKPHYIQGDRLNPLRDLLGILEFEDEPSYAPQLFLNRGIWAAVQQEGVQVLLEGLMGDNVVSHGYTYLNQLAREWHWISLYSNLQSLINHHEDPAPLWTLMSHFVWEESIKTRVPPVVKQVWRAIRGKPITQPHFTAPSFLNPDFVQRTRLEERIKERYYQARQVRTARQQHYNDLEYGLLSTAMEIYNIETARFGIEARFPFLDRRLAEYCLAIPPDQKMSHGYTRWVARQGLAPYLPEKIRLRSSKGNLGWNFLRGLKADQEIFENILNSPNRFWEQYLDFNILKRMFQRAMNGTAADEEIMAVFLSAVLVTWLKFKILSKF